MPHQCLGDFCEKLVGFEININFKIWLVSPVEATLGWHMVCHS